MTSTLVEIRRSVAPTAAVFGARRTRTGGESVISGYVDIHNIPTANSSFLRIVGAAGTSEGGRGYETNREKEEQRKRIVQVFRQR